MQFLEQLPTFLGNTRFSYDKDTGSVTQIKKGFNEKDTKYFTYPANIQSTQEVISYIKEQYNKGYKLLPAYIPEETIQTELSKSFYILKDYQKQIQIIPSKSETHSSSLNIITKEQAQPILKEIHKQLLEQVKPTTESTALPAIQTVSRLVKDLPDYITVGQLQDNHSHICLYIETHYNIILLLNTIPNINQYFTKHIILGLSYTSLINNNIIQQDTSPQPETFPLCTLVPKSKNIMIKARESNIYSKLSSPKDILPINKELLSKPYRRIIREMSHHSIMDFIAHIIEKPTSIFIYQDQTTILFIDIQDQTIYQGYTLEQNENVAIQHIKSIANTLNIASIKIGSPTSQIDLSDSKTISFELTTKALDISGSKNKSVRNQISKIDRELEAKNISITEFPFTYNQESNTYTNIISNEILNQCADIRHTWSRDWNTRHKSKSENNKDGITISIYYLGFTALVLSLIKPEIRKHFPVYAIICKDEKQELSGYLMDIQVTGTEVYNADALTLNQRAIKGLRQKTNLLAMKFWTDLNPSMIVNIGHTGLKGLKELKKQLRPTTMFRLKRI